MKGIPPEIDALMWQLAEEGGPVAQAEFEQRHVRYAPELTRRIQMVAKLRAAGKQVVHRPAFTPRPARINPAPRWTVAAAASLAVLAVGAVAYLAASADERVAIRPNPFSPPKSSVPIAPKPAPVTPAVKSVPPETPPVVEEEPQKDEPKPTPKVKYLQPQDVQIADTNLTAAIQLVAAGGGLNASLAPGFEDQKVTFDYRGSGLNTLQILKAMGEEYGFSVFEEEPGRVLLIPTEPTPDPSRRIGP